MKKQIFLVACLFSVMCGFGQSEQEKVQTAIDNFLSTENPAVGLQLLQEVEPLIKNVPDSLRANYFISLGVCFGQMGKADSSFLNLDKAEEIVRKQNAPLLLVKINNTRGLVYMGMAKYEESLESYQAALKVAENQTGPKFMEARRKIYGNSAGIFYQLGQMDKAIDYTSKGLTLSKESNDSAGMAYNHLRLALVHIDLDELEKGINHLNQSTHYLSALGDTTTLIYAENNLGGVLEKKGYLDSAFLHYQRANQLAVIIGAPEETILTLLSLANVRLVQAKVTVSQNYALQALNTAKLKNYPNGVKKAYDLLYQCALKKGQLARALNYRNEFIVLSDSLNGVEVKERVAELETKYKTARKEAEINRLSLENELNTANLRSSRNAQLAIGVGSAMLILVVVVYFTQRHRQLKVEQQAQELQIEALQKRLFEVRAVPQKVDLNLKDLNDKLHNELTEREFEVLTVSMQGQTNQEIADRISVSVNTVKFHLRNTYTKLGVSNRKEAINYVVKTS